MSRRSALFSYARVGSARLSTANIGGTATSQWAARQDPLAATVAGIHTLASESRLRAKHNAWIFPIWTRAIRRAPHDGDPPAHSDRHEIRRSISDRHDGEMRRRSKVRIGMFHVALAEETSRSPRHTERRGSSHRRAHTTPAAKNTRLGAASTPHITWRFEDFLHTPC